MSVDESILTGESEPVRKRPGDGILSGSYCVAGLGALVVEAVGVQSFAERLAAEARGTRAQLSPLQLDVNRILRATVIAMAPLAALLIGSLLIRREPLVSVAQTVVAALVPLVPEGLVLLTSLTFAVADVLRGEPAERDRMGRHGARRAYRNPGARNCADAPHPPSVQTPMRHGPGCVEHHPRSGERDSGPCFSDPRGRMATPDSTDAAIRGRAVTVDDRWTDSQTGDVCGIAERLGIEVPCPRGGCTLLAALGHEARTDASDMCPVEEIARRAGFEPVVLRTLDELRRELDRIGVTLSAVRATRTQCARHVATLDRWPRGRERVA